MNTLTAARELRYAANARSLNYRQFVNAAFRRQRTIEMSNMSQYGSGLQGIARANGASDETLAASAGGDHEEHLGGHMGLGELLATVLAFSAPVAVVSGFIPFVIVYDGIGAPGVFLAAMALLLMFAVGFTTMTRFLPRPGGFYAYVTAGLGRVPGLGAAMLAVFGYLLLGFCTLPFFAINVDSFVTGTLGGPHLPWFVYAALCWLGSGILSYLKVDLSAKVLSVAMVCETFVVGLFDLVVLHNGGPAGLSLRPFSWTSLSSGSVGLSILFAVTCFLGFEATAIFREEVKEPQRTVPRATYLAVLLIGLFYAFSAWMTITAFGEAAVPGIANQNPSGMFPIAMERYVGRFAADALHLLLATSQFAAVLSGQNILARYGMSLGIDGVFPRALGRIHPKHESPYIAAMTVSVTWFIMAVVFVAMGIAPDLLYARVAGVGGFAILALMLVTSVSIIGFFRRPDHRHDTTVWHTLVAPLVASIGLAIVVYLAITNFGTLIGGTTGDAVTLQLLTLGVFMFGAVLALIYRKARPQVYASIGRQAI